MRELVDIAEYLAAQGLGKTTGLEKTIFVNFMPATVKKGILVRQDYLGIQVDHELPGYFQTLFQIIVRTPGYAEGEALANSVFDALNRERVVIGSMQVKYIRPSQKPIVYPASNGDLIEFLINIDACYVQTS